MKKFQLLNSQAAFSDILPLLQRVATEDKTVIITSANEAWAKPGSLLDIFLEGFHIGEGIEHLLNHLIVVTLDPNALKHCEAVHPNCYLLTVDGMNFTSEKVFMSNDYIDLVWSKVKLQKRILELGYNFLFTVSRLFLCSYFIILCYLNVIYNNHFDHSNMAVALIIIKSHGYLQLTSILCFSQQLIDM